MLINFHTHHPTLLPGLLEIESVYFGQVKAPAAEARSVGLHPWYLEGIEMDIANRWLHEQAALKSVAAIGESGLDKVCNTSWDLQMLAFHRCAEISESVGKPLIIHCVRAYSEILALKKQWKPRQTWIFHGFNKNVLTAEMLLRAGCCLSFGAALLREKSHATKSFKVMPEDRFFLETDDTAVSISAVYERAAELRGINLGELEMLVERNFGHVFGIDLPGF